MQNTKLECVYLPLRLNFRVNCTSAEEWPEQLFRVYFGALYCPINEVPTSPELIVESTQADLSQLLPKQVSRIMGYASVYRLLCFTFDLI
jgi:hypothetical protein